VVIVGIALLVYAEFASLIEMMIRLFYVMAVTMHTTFIA
jgi:hypothetical protein